MNLGYSIIFKCEYVTSEAREGGEAEIMVPSCTGDGIPWRYFIHQQIFLLVVERCTQYLNTSEVFRTPPYRLANLRVGQLHEIGNGAIFGSMITYKRLVKMGQKSQASLTQMVKFWWGNCVNLKQNG